MDLDLHHPPCRGYRANQAFYAYGRMAHLLLRAVQYRLLPKAARRHGIRPLGECQELRVWATLG